MAEFDWSQLPPAGFEDWGRGEWFWWCGTQPDSPFCEDVPSYFG